MPFGRRDQKRCLPKVQLLFRVSLVVFFFPFFGTREERRSLLSSKKRDSVVSCVVALFNAALVLLEGTTREQNDDDGEIVDDGNQRSAPSAEHESGGKEPSAAHLIDQKPRGDPAHEIRRGGGKIGLIQIPAAVCRLDIRREPHPWQRVRVKGLAARLCVQA